MLLPLLVSCAVGERFTYPGLNAYEQEEARDAVDPDPARVAGAMPLVEGTLAYEIYRECGRL
jgi:hypothetical protein